MTNVVVCPSCKGERWEGTGPCGNCGAAVVSSSPDIPDAAIEAAGEVFYGPVWDGAASHAGAEVRAALAAAYPALTRQAVEDERQLIAQTIHAERGRVMRKTDEDDEEANGEIVGLTKAWNIARARIARAGGTP